MSEKRHVPTHPNENVSPEIVHNAVDLEPGAHAEQDGRGLLTVALVTLLAALLLTLLVAGLQALYYRERDSQIALKDDHANPQLMRIWRQQAARLKPRWINQSQGTAAIGIQAAKRLVVRELNTPQARRNAAGQAGMNPGVTTGGQGSSGGPAMNRNGGGKHRQGHPVKANGTPGQNKLVPGHSGP